MTDSFGICGAGNGRFTRLPIIGYRSEFEGLPQQSDAPEAPADFLLSLGTVPPEHEQFAHGAVAVYF